MPTSARPEPEGLLSAPMTLLFSSGTTGEPKAIPWSHVTPLRCALDCYANLDLRRGDVFVGRPPWVDDGRLLDLRFAA